MGIIYIILLFLSAIPAFSNDSGLFDDLKIKTNLKNDEIMFVIYQNPGTCIKCYLEPLDIIEAVEKNKQGLKIKYIALVRCDREIELKVFKRETSWKYFMYVDDGTARKKLSASESTIISLLNSKGENLLNLKGGNILENKKKILKLMKSLSN